MRAEIALIICLAVAAGFLAGLSVGYMRDMDARATIERGRP